MKKNFWKLLDEFDIKSKDSKLPAIDVNFVNDGQLSIS
mgnify:CR=1 FL=1